MGARRLRARGWRLASRGRQACGQSLRPGSALTLGTWCQNRTELWAAGRCPGRRRAGPWCKTPLAGVRRAVSRAADAPDLRMPRRGAGLGWGRTGVAAGSAPGRGLPQCVDLGPSSWVWRALPGLDVQGDESRSQTLFRSRGRGDSFPRRDPRQGRFRYPRLWHPGELGSVAAGVWLRDKSQAAPRQQAGRSLREAHLWNEPLGLAPCAGWGQPQGPVQSSEPVAIEAGGQEVERRWAEAPAESCTKPHVRVTQSPSEPPDRQTAARDGRAHADRSRVGQAP